MEPPPPSCRRRRPLAELPPTQDEGDDDDDDEHMADGGAAASVKPKASKRARTSIPSASQASGVSFVSQETEVIAPHARAVTAGRLSLEPRRLDVENGTLLNVRLVNFKSHAHFSMDFGPRLNFIVGRNGTGKSSILAAIIVALGGNPNKHSGTAGGSKAASGLIRDGSDSAQVELTIANGCGDAFTLDNGSAPATLVVRIRLAKTSETRTSSSFAINEQSVPLRKVRELADFYAYEVENPTVINTQAVSASFLKESKDAHRRYSFFLRASNLESLKLDFASGHEELRKMGERLSNHEARRAALYERLEEAKRRADAARDRLSLECECAQAERRAAYSHIATHRAALEHAKAASAEAEARAKAAAEQTAAAKADHAAARRSVESANAERKARLERLDHTSRRATQLGKELKELKRRLRALHDDAEAADVQQHDACAAVAELGAALDEQRAGLDASTRAADTRLRKQIAEREDAHSAALAAASAASLDLTPVEQAASEARAALAHCHSRLADCSREQQEHAAEAARLKAAASAGSSASGAEAACAVFHRAMPALLRAVKSKGGWHAFEPVGPLGMHLAIQPQHQQHFGFAIERALGGWTVRVARPSASHMRALTTTPREPPPPDRPARFVRRASPPSSSAARRTR